jgi:hypothetical protein
MKKVKIIPFKHLPAKLPVYHTILLGVVTYYTDINFVVAYILWSMILLSWVANVVKMLRQEKVSLKELANDED